jgi:hypothetical protein
VRHPEYIRRRSTRLPRCSLLSSGETPIILLVSYCLSVLSCHCIVMMEPKFVCSYAKACVLPPLAGVVVNFPFFSHVIFSIHLKPTQSFHCAQSAVVLSFNDRLPLLHSPHFLVIARVVDAPPRYLQKNYSTIHPFHPFVESRPRFVPPPVACMPPSPRPSFVHLWQLFFSLFYD